MSNKTKYIILTIFSILLISFTAAEYEIEILDEPTNYDVISPEKENIRLVNITNTDTDQQVTENRKNTLGIDLMFNADGEGDRDSLEYWTDLENYESEANDDTGIWYAVVEPQDPGAELDIEYAVAETDADTDEIDILESREEDVSVSETEIVVERFPESPIRSIKPDQIIEVSVFEDSDRQTEEDIEDPRLEFSKLTDSEDKGRLGFDAETFSRDFTTPEQADTNYITQVTIPDEEGDTLTTKNMFLETRPPLEGELHQFESSECNMNDLTDQITGGYEESVCEGNATMDVGYEIIESEAEEVNITVELFNRTQNDWEVVEEHPMDYTGSNMWNQTFNFPFIDDESYDAYEGAQIGIEAVSDTRTDTEEGIINYEAFEESEIIDFSPSGGRISQGQTVGAEFDIRRPFSGTNVHPDYLEYLNVTVHDPEEEIFEEYTIEDLDVEDGLYSIDIETSADSIPGSYPLEVEAHDIYSGEVMSSRTINVDDLEQTFDLDPLEFDIDKKGEHQEILNVTNVAEDDDLMIEAEIPEEINNTLNIENATEMEIDNPYREYPIELNITEMEDVEDEVVFHDVNSDYNQTIDFEVETPDCNFKDGELCSLTGQTIREEHDEIETIERNIDILYIGAEENTTLNVASDGNISDHINYNLLDTTLNQTHDQTELVIEYDYSQPGYFEGDITVSSNYGELDYQTSMNSTVPPQDLEFEFEPENYEADEPIIEGEDYSMEIEMENTGDMDIDQIEADSGEFDIELEQENIGLSPGEHTTLEIQLQEVNQETGEITIDGSTEDEQGSQTISVSFDQLTEDYEGKIDDLLDEISTIRAEDTGGVAEEELSNAEGDIDEASILWSSGDREEAITYYEDAEAEVRSAETTVEQDQEDQEQPGDPGDTDNGQDDPQEGGGIPLIPIFGGLFIVLLVGFVAYSSIIPEEGDPLYDVLGR